MSGAASPDPSAAADPSSIAVPSPADIEAAAARIAGRVRATPTLDAEVDGRALSFKLEFLQAGGTFKARGAFNRLLACDPARLRAAGVVAASGGNHGIAVALAARALGVPAHVFVPAATPAAKLARLQALGATVRREGDAYADALAASRAHARASGAIESHAYDQFETVAGQGTVALEWARQAPALDTVLVAVGGGGLVAGLAAWWRGAVRVVAVESDGCPTLHAALRAGRPVDIEPRGLAADSLGARRIGDIAFEAARRGWIERALLAPDDAIRAAQRALWSSLRVAAEPGGAAAYAALLRGAYVPAPGERVGVLLCGANVDPATLSEPAPA